MRLTRTWLTALALVAGVGVAVLVAKPPAPDQAQLRGEAQALQQLADASYRNFTQALQDSPVAASPQIREHYRLARDVRNWPDEPDKDQKERLQKSFDTALKSFLRQHEDDTELSVFVVNEEGAVLAQHGEFPVQELSASRAFAASLPGASTEAQLFVFNQEIFASITAPFEGKPLYLVAFIPLNPTRNEVLALLEKRGTSMALTQNSTYLWHSQSAPELAQLSPTSEFNLLSSAPSPAKVLWRGPEDQRRLSARLHVPLAFPGLHNPERDQVWWNIYSTEAPPPAELGLWPTLRRSLEQGGLTPKIALLAMLLLGGGFGLWLSEIEHSRPLRRLENELQDLAQNYDGRIQVERYRGLPARLAAAAQALWRSAAAAKLSHQSIEISTPLRSANQIAPAPRSHRTPVPPEIPLPSINPTHPSISESALLFDPVDAKVALEHRSKAPAAPLFKTLGNPDPMAGSPPQSPRVRQPTYPLQNPVPAEDKELRELYQQFCETRNACGEQEELSFENFSQKIARTRASILSEGGVKDLQFSVYVKNGKAALKARVRKITQPGGIKAPETKIASGQRQS